MRKKLVAGNWKMNMTVEDSITLVESILASKITSMNLRPDVVLFPPYTSLYPVREKISSGKIAIGAQNIHHKNEGAYTGEISASMVVSCGCEYVLLGHSERRQYCYEDDFLINLKLKKALQAYLIPIVCVGETLAQREDGSYKKIVDNQVTLCLKDITKEEAEKVIIAYEPVWAIGTGKTATPEQANDMHKMIREALKNLYGDETSEKMRILYGGSVNENNSSELFSQSDIDGGLIGGASLKADSFVKIILSANKKN